MKYYLTEEGRKFKNRVTPGKQPSTRRTIAAAYGETEAQEVKISGGTPEQVAQARLRGVERGRRKEVRGEGR